MVPYKTFPYMGCPYMPKIHIWLAYVHVMYGPIYDFFLQGLVLSTKRLVEATKNSFVVPNFVAVTKPFFPCNKDTFTYCISEIQDTLKINS